MFNAYGIPATWLPGLIDAAVGKPTTSNLRHSTLKRGSLCLVVAHSRIMMTRGKYINCSYILFKASDRFFVVVITLYSLSGAKTTTHGWVNSVDNIGLVSYAAVQLFEHTRETIFCAVTRETVKLHTHAFSHLSSDCILQCLVGSSQLSPDHQTLAVDKQCLQAYQGMSDAKLMPHILEAVRALVKARRTSAKCSRGCNRDSEDSDGAA